MSSMSPIELSLYYFTQNLKTPPSAEKIAAMSQKIQELCLVPMTEEGSLIPVQMGDNCRTFRPLVFFPDSYGDGVGHKILVCNDTEEDRILGRGAEKSYVLGIDILSGKKFAITNFTAQNTTELNTLLDLGGTPGLVEMPYVLKDEKSPVAFFKYYACGDLSSFVQRHPDILKSHNKRFALFYDLISAVASLHEKNYVHRDIKPANFLIEDPKDFHAVLADLGFACPVDQLDRANICGTPYYIAPEQARAVYLSDRADPKDWHSEKHKAFIDEWRRTSGKKCDIWALGTMLLNLSQTESFPWLPQMIKNEKRVVLFHWMKGLFEKKQDLFKEPPSGTLAHLIWQMLRIDPDKRISSEKIESEFSSIDVEKERTSRELLRLVSPFIYPIDMNWDIYNCFVENLKKLPIQWENGEEDIHRVAYQAIRAAPVKNQVYRIVPDKTGKGSPLAIAISPMGLRAIEDPQNKDFWIDLRTGCKISDQTLRSLGQAKQRASA